MEDESSVINANRIVEGLCFDSSCQAGHGIGVLVINYNTAFQTLRCLESIRNSTLQPDWVIVLDNASSAGDYQQLLDGASMPHSGSLQVYRSDDNLGFAEGSNVLINLLLRRPACRFVMLLNNDAVAEQDMLSSLHEVLKNEGQKTGLAGGRMHKLAEPAEVDTLGIAIYASLMPADRKNVKDFYFGPTGGCCMLTRGLLEQLKNVSGYYFDPRFFCYCEDTDLAMRAVLLGYQPVYLDQLLALHEGQASSGGGYNQFVAYHGLRNALWMHIKLMPSDILWKYGIFLLLAHLMMIARHVSGGNFSLIFRIYRDAFGRASEFCAERKIILSHCEINTKFLGDRVTKKFYRSGYLRLVLKNSSIFKRFFWF